MEIRFRSKKIEKILTDNRLIQKYYTKEYKGIINRMVELNAVSNLAMISHNPPPRKHRLTGNLDGYWSVDVSKNFRLIFTSPCNEQDERLITVIIIEDIIDTH